MTKPPEPPVSRETFAKFQTYIELLAKWQKAVNLVGPDTLGSAMTRHIEDSSQLASFIPASARTLYDLGSGAGFPGLVLAMLRPEMEVNLVESDSKKCTFLRTVSRETQTPVIIHNSRIEEVVKASAQAPDLVTARALASLTELFAYVLPWAEANPGLILLFPKGEKAEGEIEEARRTYEFELTRHPSQTAPRACILEVRGLCIKKK